MQYTINESENMDLITIFLIIIFILLMILFAIGLKYPQGRKDWPLDRRTTTSVLISIFVFLLLIILSFYASQNVKWPPRAEVFVYASIIIFIILIIIAIILPSGLSAEEGKKSE
ncbi:MAG: hypothetical protein JSV49_04180 [Thermoplasmata archaeon]|nr:MAG: hypothetical protein JSV49_04180 [Thermoplasmata archaeon]